MTAPRHATHTSLGAGHPRPEGELADEAEEPTTTDWEVTGNHYVTMPEIDTGRCAVHSLNVLHRRLGGLIEWSADDEATPGGTPFLRPFLRIAGDDATLEPERTDRLDRWIPNASGTIVPGVSFQWTACAPGGFDPLVRGATIRLEIRNRTTGPISVEGGVDGCWRWSSLIVASRRPLDTRNRIARGANGDLALETGGPAGIALGLSGGSNTRCLVAEGDAPLAPLEAGAGITVENGVPIRFRVLRAATIPPGKRASLAVYIGIAPERDGATATAAHLARLGADELLRLARLDLTRLARTPDDARLLELLNRNLLFNHYCGVARAIDDDRLYTVLSRSPAHGVCAAFAERQALLWTLPALTLTDPLLAREALGRMLEQYSDRPGQRWRYIDGGLLAPGFMLDHLVAWGIAVERYARETNDEAIIEDPLVQETIRDIDENVYSRLHPDVFLCETELMPSGDTAEQPYVSYDNVLLWSFARALKGMWRAAEGDAPPRLEDADDEISAAFWQRCTVDVDGVPVIGCSTDLRGHTAIYDDPAGSLRMLPYLGFCTEDDPIWSNTMELLHSARYPLWLGARAFPGHVTREAPARPHFAALCADLLTGRRAEAIERLLALRLTGGIASRTFDPDTGRSADGPHAAAEAGFLGWAILARSRKAASDGKTRKR